MKRKEKYKIFNHARRQYNKAFDLNLQFKYLSKRTMYELLKKYKHSSMRELSYCCYGLYENCWQEPFADGTNFLEQKDVDRIIKSVIDATAKACKRDSRILYYEASNKIDVIIVMRDVWKTDYLITFTNEEH